MQSNRRGMRGTRVIAKRHRQRNNVVDMHFRVIISERHGRVCGKKVRRQYFAVRVNERMGNITSMKRTRVEQNTGKGQGIVSGNIEIPLTVNCGQDRCVRERVKEQILQSTRQSCRDGGNKRRRYVFLGFIILMLGKARRYKRN